ncbi:MAG TPA: hypothetical protein PKK26_14155, partial [Candidatus Wallbacteria bacterium]|nr:hypothetical protein [Candidatus Wallbacteria bacterium]
MLPGAVSSDKVLEISGMISISSAPGIFASPKPDFAYNFGGGKYCIQVVDKDNPGNEIGNVTLTGSSYKASIPITNAAGYPMITIRENNGGRILYRNL